MRPGTSPCPVCCIASRRSCDPPEVAWTPHVTAAMASVAHRCPSSRLRPTAAATLPAPTPPRAPLPSQRLAGAACGSRGTPSRRRSAARRHRLAATPSDDEKLPEIEGVDYEGIEALAQSLSSAAAGLKIEELEAQAKSSMKEADLLEGQAAAVELEAERLELEIARRNEGEQDEKKIMIHERMLAVARLDAKEQRMLADSVRAMAEKAVVNLEDALKKRAAENDSGSEQP